MFGGRGQNKRLWVLCPLLWVHMDSYLEIIYCNVVLSSFLLLYLLFQLLLKEWPLKISQATARPSKASHRLVPRLRACAESGTPVLQPTSGPLCFWEQATTPRPTRSRMFTDQIWVRTSQTSRRVG